MTADLDGTLQLLDSLRPVQSYGKVTKVVRLVFFQTFGFPLSFREPHAQLHFSFYELLLLLLW